MTAIPEDGVVVLYKGGRLPTWDGLTPEQQAEYQDEHVSLMLSVAKTHRLKRLEGFQLMTPQHNWERFWTIAFPTLQGAQSWIDSEIAPPYGRYGFYEYFMALPWRQDYFSSWVTAPQPEPGPEHLDPRFIPPLRADNNSVVVLKFGRWLPDSDDVAPQDRGDEERTRLMRAVAEEHGLMRYEAFKLMGPQEDWDLVWILEFPTLAGAEAWIDAEGSPPHSQYATRSFFLARKWAPEYFASWIPDN
jgi:hypothetical protein